MAYAVIQMRRFARQYKKLNDNIAKDVDGAVGIVANKPSIGERKKGDLDFSYASGRMGKNENAQFQYKYLYMDKVNNTILAGDQCVLFDYPRFRNFDELCEAGSYPKDYNFMGNKTEYLVGMSVPPVMTAQIATKVYDQWLSKL